MTPELICLLESDIKSIWTVINCYGVPGCFLNICTIDIDMHHLKLILQPFLYDHILGLNLLGYLLEYFELPEIRWGYK